MRIDGELAGVSVDYTPYAAPATVLQRFWRGRRALLNRAATRINALMRAFSVRCFVAGYNSREWLLHMNERRTMGIWPQQRLTPYVLRGGRRYLGFRMWRSSTRAGYQPRGACSVRRVHNGAHHTPRRT